MILALLTSVICYTGVQARADKSNPEMIASFRGPESGLSLTLGKAEMIDVAGMVSDVMVANPSVIDVQAVQANKLYIVGTALGDTNIMALDEGGNVLKRINVHVHIDELTLQNSLDQLFPDETVRAKTVNNQVILTGEVSTPGNASRIQDLATRFTGDSAGIINMMNVGGEQQVMLRVRIMEASRNLFKELGVETEVTDIGDVLGNRLEGGLTLRDSAGLTRDAFGIGTATISKGAFGPINIVIRALEEDGLVNVLAEPNLTSISGETASFLAGGEIPVPTGRDSQGNIQVQYRAFGVRLSFKPVVLSDGRISLQLNSEVSSLNNANAVAGIPGLDTRNVQTTVELPSGGSLMIAGLLQSQTAKGMTGLPGIASVPVLGELFKSRNFQRAETELVVMITPYLVKSVADTEQATAIPAAADTPLAHAFAANLRRVYKGNRLPADLLTPDQPYGYIIN